MNDGFRRWHSDHQEGRAIGSNTKRLRRKHEPKGVEASVVHSYLVHAGRQGVDFKSAEGIGLERHRAALHYNVGAGQESAVEAVDNHANDVRFAGRRGVILGDDGRRKKDPRRGDEELQLCGDCSPSLATALPTVMVMLSVPPPSSAS